MLAGRSVQRECCHCLKLKFTGIFPVVAIFGPETSLTTVRAATTSSSNSHMESERIVTELVFSRQTSNLTAGFVGTVICWIAGIGTAVAAVSFSVAGGLTTKLLGVVVLLAGGMLCGFARTGSARWKLRLSAVLISFVAMLLVAECLLRMLTHYPVNTTSNVVPHPELGYVLSTSLADVDENGFRNESIPESVDIVAIGDSHTQGINASSDESWPQRLGTSLDQTVYNMGVGGYGPLHYVRLIDKALELKPKHIIIGLYTGNDLGDVHRGIRPRDSQSAIDNRFRYLLKYQTAIGSAVTQTVKRSSIGRPTGFAIDHRVNPTYISSGRLAYLKSDVDLSESEIVKALATTVQSIKLAREKCDRADVRLTVLLIPTRELVYFQANENSDEVKPIRGLAELETGVREKLKTAFHTSRVPCADALPDLVTAISDTPGIYPSHDDGHPLPTGYAVYAAAAQKLVSTP